MKRFLFIFLLSILVGNIYSQNLSFRTDKYLDATNENIEFTFYDGFRVKGYKNGNTNAGFYTGSYTITEEYGINYLIILWDDKTWDKYLMIADTNQPHKKLIDLYFYNADGKPFFSGGKVPNPEYFTIYPEVIDPKILSASSTLKEGGKVFSTDNLDSRIGVCWAEGVKGNGIGEKIIVKHHEKLWLPFYIDISIGFVSFEKPNLYKENSRPKKLRISDEGENPRIVELADTPNLQSLGGVGSEKDLWIEILEVYPGTKYTDTCINFFQVLMTQ